MALTTNHPLLKEVRVYCHLADGAAVTTAYTVSPIRGKIVKVQAVAGAVVDSDRTITTSIGATAITGGAITQTASGSAAGDVSSATPTAANAVNEGDTISFASDGAGSTACPTTMVATIQMA